MGIARTAFDALVHPTRSNAGPWSAGTSRPGSRRMRPDRPVCRWRPRKPVGDPLSAPVRASSTVRWVSVTTIRSGRARDLSGRSGRGVRWELNAPSAVDTRCSNRTRPFHPWDTRLGERGFRAWGMRVPRIGGVGGIGPCWSSRWWR